MAHRYCLPAGTCCVSMFSVLWLTAMLVGQEPAKTPDTGIQRAEMHMQRCEMRLKDASRQSIERINHPLLEFGDSARGNTAGTLWAYGKAGRPLAFIELFKGSGENPVWVHAATLTGTQQVVLKTPLGQAWQPEEVQIKPATIANVFVPEAKEVARLRQLKDLSRRFTAHEFWDPDNSRFELRLLVKPVHRYSDPAGKIQDGAVFAFANGTNPEVLVLIEAVGDDLKNARWQYSLARLGSAELHVALDGQEVWKRERTPGVVGRAADPYWLFFSPATDPGTDPEMN